MRIGIVGCGTAGPAAALFLAQAGHAVTLYERVPDPGPAGAGIMLQPAGMEVLARLGLLEEVLGHGQRIDALQGLSHRGRTVLDLRYTDAGPGWFGMGLHRGVLFETLIARVRASAVELRCGASVEDIDEDGAFLQVDGRREGPFELLVIADGARSTLRERVTRVRRAARYPWGAMWAVVEQPPDWQWPHTLRQIYRGPQGMVGFLPTGRAPGSDRHLLSLFWSLRLDAHEALVARGIEAWRQEVCALAPEAAPILAQVPDLDLPLAAYLDVVLHPRGRRTAILGDAAHAMSPQLGQGANFALVDAACLADALTAAPTVDAALHRYARQTVARMGPFQHLTRWLTPVFQSELPLVGPLRDAFFGPMCRFPPVRMAMIDGLTGRRALPFGLRRSPVPPPASLLTGPG